MVGIQAYQSTTALKPTNLPYDLATRAPAVHTQATTLLPLPRLMRWVQPCSLARPRSPAALAAAHGSPLSYALLPRTLALRAVALLPAVLPCRTLLPPTLPVALRAQPLPLLLPLRDPDEQTRHQLWAGGRHGLHGVRVHVLGFLGNGRGKG